jgi:hypothetical protein
MPDKSNLTSQFNHLIRLRFPYFFISLFLALHFVYLYYLSFSPELTGFKGRMIGMGALEYYDVTSRVTFFYHALFILVAAFFSVNAIINSLDKRKRLHDFEAIPFSWLSAIGCAGLIMFVTIGTGLWMTQLALFSFIPFIVLIFIRQTLKRHPQEIPESSLFFVWIYILAFVIAFLASYFISSGTTLLIMTATLAVTLLTSLFYFFRAVSDTFKKTAYRLLPLSWIPLLLVAASELAMIINQRERPFAGSFFFAMLALVIVAGMVIYRHYKTKSQIIPEIKSTMSRYFLWILAGFSTWFLWQPVMPSVNELFEIANPANALMRIISFKEIPLLHFLNSHFFSEIIPGLIYFVLNCYDGSQAFLLYNFTEYIAIIILAYYVISHSTGNKTLAFLFLLFIPFVPELTDEKMFLSLVTLFFLLKVYRNPSLKNSIVYWIAVFSVCLYSPDMAPASVLALLAVAVFTPGFLQLFPFKTIVRSFLWIALPVLVLISAIIVISEIPFAVHFHQTVMYLTAGNSHGVISVWPEITRTVVAQYFLLPFIILILLVFVLSRRKQLFESSRFLYSSMVFMMVFFFFNFQRGLLRHGFNEGHDGFVVSFGFFIIALSPYLLLRTKEIYRHLLFAALSFYLVWQWGFPEPSGNRNLFENSVQADVTRMHIAGGQGRTCRVQTVDADYAHNISEFTSFGQRYLTPGQTFGDMSNSPALYYYTQKPVPSFFCQGIHNAVTDRQQEYLLQHFADCDIPFFVMANVPANWFDATDGVPNYIRHYRIAEYVFARYHPWKIIGSHAVWIRNDLQFPDAPYTNDTIFGKPLKYELKLLPRLWAEYGSDHAVELKKAYTVYDFQVHYNTHFTVNDDSLNQYGGNCYIDAEICDSSGLAFDYIMDFGNDWLIFGEFHFTLQNRKPIERYRFRVSTQYNWHSRKVNFVRIRPADENGRAQVLSIKLFEAD